eukprot:6831153-Karenia_brevis.AAC.1
MPARQDPLTKFPELIAPPIVANQQNPSEDASRGRSRADQAKAWARALSPTQAKEGLRPGH